MSNPINNDKQLTFDLDIFDVGQPDREHRSEEVMTDLYELLNRYIISDTEPAKADRHVGQMWLDISITPHVLWICDSNTEFTIQGSL